MTAFKAKYRVLVASMNDKIFDYIAGLLPPADYEPAIRAHDAGEAKRLLLQLEVDVVIINTPLADEFGMDTALDIVSEGHYGVLLLVKREIYDQVCDKVEDSGVLTVGKPSSRQEVYSAIRLLSALSVRLVKMEKRIRTLQEKMDDIRTVNRAKWLLIEKHHMSEKDAHYYIEKQAMDNRLSRKEVAEHIIRTYDN